MDHELEQQDGITGEGPSLDIDPGFDPAFAPRLRSPSLLSDSWTGLDDGGLAGPGLELGRGLELTDLALGDIETELGGIGGPGTDKSGAFAKLNDLAAKKHQQIDQDTTVQEEVAAREEPASTEASPDQATPDVAPAPTVKPKPKFAPPPSVKMAGDRDGMRTQIEVAGEKELSQIDAAFDRQVADLDTRFDGQLGGLESEITKQTASIDSSTEKVDQKLVADIGGRSEKHQAQIKIGTTAHTAQVEKQQKPLAASADAESTATYDLANQQSSSLLATANTRATETRATGTREAAAARASGESKAQQAIAAASGKAQQNVLEAVGIMAEGAKRAAQAKTEGERQAKAIEARSESTAKQLVADGQRMSDAQAGTRRTTAVGKVEVAHQTQKQRIQTQADVANAEMQGHAAEAHKRMEAERGTFQSDAGGKKTGATDEMSIQRTEAAKKAADLKVETVEKMRATHEKERAKVLAKTKKLLADLASAKDKDLARVGKKLGRELYELDQADQTSERAMKKQVKRAESTLASDIHSRKRKVRASAAKAKVAIEAMVRDARKRIAAADKPTFQAIAHAAKRGEEAIKNVGADALVEMGKAGAASREELTKLAAADDTALATTTTQAETDMAGMTADVSKNVNKQWVDDAVKQSNALLDDTGITNVVTDGEATRAMNILTSLPPDVQGDAIAGLGDEQFANLLDEVPSARREEFESLVHATKDPKRKLALFGEYHKSMAVNDAERKKGDTGEDEWFWNRTDAQSEAKRRHEARVNAADDTEDEVDEELEFLREKEASGTPITMQDVDDLMERKKTEHDMEMKYNVNITNEEGARKDGSKIVWSKKELDALEASFGQIPESHMAGNKLLKEVRREDVHDGGAGDTHSGGVVKVFDIGASVDGTSSGFRHDGEARELASPHICRRCGIKITTLDMVVTHEIGHDMHDQNDELFEKYQKIAGWEEQSEGDLEDAGLSEAEIKQLEDNREKNYSSRPNIRKNGKIYMVDPYGGGYLVVDDTAIPESTETANGQDSWGYARSNYKDHFAEHYAKAVHTPEQLHKDLVSSPHAATVAAEQKLAAAQQGVTDAGSDPGLAAAAQAKLDEAQRQLDHSRKAEDQRKDQFDLMRNDVFDTDTAQSDAKARLVAKGVSEEKIREFEANAAKASTPEQIKTLEANYP